MLNFKFENNIDLSFDLERACVTSIKRCDHELIFKKLPFFSVKLRKKDNSYEVLTSFDFHYESFADGIATYSNENLDVSMKIIQLKNGLSFSFSIINKTNDVIEWLELNSFGLNPKLKDEEGVGSILFPYNEGCLVTNMARREASPFPYIEPDYPSLGRYVIFPNMISSQFMLYLLDGYGIYFGLHDKERGTKHIDFKYEDNSLKIVNRIYTNVNYGEDFKMDFEAYLLFFEGDVYDGMEIYKSWFEKNKPLGLLKIRENKRIPEWFLSSPIVLTFPIRGRFDTDKMIPNGFYPYKNGLRIIDDFANLLDSKVMALLMHYEGSAPWAPPYVYPPYGGEKEFKDYVSLVHEHGHYVGLYCSGFGWTERSNLIEGYDMHDEFVKNGYAKLMCSNSNGDLKSLICEAQRSGYDICPSQDEAKHLWADEISKLITTGVDYVQALDQNHGGSCYFCYSSEHGHPPVPGKWQQIETNKAIETIKKSDDVLLGCESGAAEPFLAKLQFSDNRFNLNYYIGLPFPLYSYLYHEYVNNFMGNGICNTLSKEPYNYTYKVAYSFTCGDMLTASINDDGGINHSWGEITETNKDEAITLLRNLNYWRVGIGQKYLVYGRKIRPINVLCDTISFVTEDSTRLTLPSLQTGAFEYDGEKLQFIVNFQNKKIKAEFNEEHMIFLSPKDEEKFYAKEIEIEPLSAIMVKI